MAGRGEGGARSGWWAERDGGRGGGRGEVNGAAAAMRRGRLTGYGAARHRKRGSGSAGAGGADMLARRTKAHRRARDR